MHDQATRIDEFVDAARSLPLSADGAIEAVVDACDDPRSAMGDIAERIAREPGLAAIVLRQANSAHYGYGRRVDTVLDAAVVLGIGTIRSLAITSAVLRFLAIDRDGLSAFRRDLLRHSVGVGIAARTLARRQNTAHPEKAFLSGLLHELGTIILTRSAKGEYLLVLSRARAENAPLTVVERQVFGFDHCELGARLAELWRFPPPICEAIAHQEDPQRSRLERGLAETLHVADWLTAKMGQPAVPFGIPDWPERRSTDTFGLSPHNLPELVEEIQRESAGWAAAAA